MYRNKLSMGDWSPLQVQWNFPNFLFRFLIREIALWTPITDGKMKPNWLRNLCSTWNKRRLYILDKFFFYNPERKLFIARDGNNLTLLAFNSDNFRTFGCNLKTLVLNNSLSESILSTENALYFCLLYRGFWARCLQLYVYGFTRN